MFAMKFHIRYSEIDRSGHLSMDGLLRIFQDSGYAHAEARNMGIARTIPEGRTWYLLNWNIQMREAPKVGEDVVVETWFYYLQGPVAKKSLVMKKDDIVIACADTMWVYMDVEKQEPMEAPKDQWPSYDFDSAYPMPKEVRSMSVARRIPQISADTMHVLRLPDTNIRPCHVDTNGHANNTKLTEFAMELAGYDCQMDGCMIRAEYVKQVKLTDLLHPYLLTENGIHYLSLKNASEETLANFVFA